MIKRTLFMVVAMASAQQLLAQDVNFEKETWADKPAIHNIDPKYAKEAAVIITDTRKTEYTDVSKDEIAEYYTIHMLVHINDDRGIEGFNKIYLGFWPKIRILLM